MLGTNPNTLRCAVSPLGGVSRSAREGQGKLCSPRGVRGEGCGLGSVTGGTDPPVGWRKAETVTLTTVALCPAGALKMEWKRFTEGYRYGGWDLVPRGPTPLAYPYPLQHPAHTRPLPPTRCAHPPTTSCRGPHLGCSLHWL